MIRALFLALLLTVLMVDAGFVAARYKRNMIVGRDGEDERVTAQKLYRRKKVRIENPNPPLPHELTVKSRSYHYNYGPVYPSHHRHLQEQFFPLKKNELLHP